MSTNLNISHLDRPVVCILAHIVSTAFHFRSDRLSVDPSSPKTSYFWVKSTFDRFLKSQRRSTGNPRIPFLPSRPADSTFPLQVPDLTHFNPFYPQADWKHMHFRPRLYDVPTHFSLTFSPINLWRITRPAPAPEFSTEDGIASGRRWRQSGGA